MFYNDVYITLARLFRSRQASSQYSVVVGRFRRVVVASLVVVVDIIVVVITIVVSDSEAAVSSWNSVNLAKYGQNTLLFYLT